MQKLPTVLVLSGLDPSGGAGIQADIQAITALGAHPLPVVTCLTVQDTRNVYDSVAVDTDLLRRQLMCLREDIQVDAIKLGALGSAAIVDLLVDFLRSQPPCPLVLDPVIKAAGGGELADNALVARMRQKLFPRATVITPNGPELSILGDDEDPQRAAMKLLDGGCPAVLATGGHGEDPLITNRLYTRNAAPKDWKLKRNGGEYHGSGCTLAAALSAGLARRQSLSDAIENAQSYVSGTINRALRVGRGQPVPYRGPTERTEGR
ncbi:bifunctional hydroxymethylpyrimidine kinase/phosphomethylpyrimidine kinase [Hydrocarboniclastica marina]|uniref:hydroxymethylpyrimidine kinase n=1 Tax=Hydrocarboniclastica marina TaxID=2259620 RepID=A0A4P7XDN7_9ALTE|nr:hydroxymethylpyrimidine/phosphomethylpyrimidine kinase [Hydrocarboniclastica marina]MAL99977.1 hydroxymethylpyrimidine/phosphomethylpyrimidine kinase [Alteromonadaceae bacterium]QCF24928.1 hydroxymethylpyrimidine/phosphomethylpyrimidine kinase [Hydrocarboniclastica marina]|tara:strand:+ start:1574 stop:2365 length:792 start_codon:yes stop_codon:yes gene_type:complete